MRILLGILCLLVSSGVAQVTVQISTPQPYSTFPAAIHVQATASSSNPIAGWQVYLDNTDAYTAPAGEKIDTYISGQPGDHEVTIRAWDTTGVYGSQRTKVTVSRVSVQVSARRNLSDSGSIHLQGAASSSEAITGWQIYLDNADVYTGPASGTMDADIHMTEGSHQLVIRAWDAGGAYGSQSVQANVSDPDPSTPPATGDGLPVPPSTARIFRNIEEADEWGSCNSAHCAGGSGEGTYWHALNQTLPSLDGRSMDIYQDGKWSNALWWHKVGADRQATNFLWDFYVRLDAGSLNAGQALEYDAFQFVDGYNYMIGTECNYAAGVWDTWNEATQHWLHTSIPCKKFAPETWHHIQWYMTADHNSHTYTYKTLVVDGTAYNLDQTQPAKYLGWHDDAGVQWQLDVNASGAGYHEWIDRSTFTIW
jgi:hypothetical protein